MEVFCLYNLKKQAGVVYKRLFVQVAYLIGDVYKRQDYDATGNYKQAVKKTAV